MKSLIITESLKKRLSNSRGRSRILASDELSINYDFHLEIKERQNADSSAGDQYD